MDAFGEFFGGEPDEVFKAGGIERGERYRFDGDVDGAGFALAGERDLGVGEEAGVEEMLGGVGEGVVDEELAWGEAGDGEELGVSVGGGVLEDDVGDGVLGVGEGCGGEKEEGGEGSA